MFGRAFVNYALPTALACLLTVSASGQTEAGFCWTQNFTRGAGGVSTACGTNAEWNAGLCYPKCDPGWEPFVTQCRQVCPPGFKDIGVSCEKPPNITTAGYPWKAGDPPLPNNSAAKERCEAAHGSGRCYESDSIWYPHCPANYRKEGNNLCTPVCPAGFAGDSASHCLKSTKNRGTGYVPSCGSGQESDAGLCYPSCGAGFKGVGPVCWGSCPSTHPVTCGAACARSTDECAAAVGDMVMNTTGVALNLLSFAFGGPGITTAVKSAASAGRSAAAQGALRTASRSVDDIILGATKQYAKGFAKEFVKANVKNQLHPTNLYWRNLSLLKIGALRALNQSSTEFGVMKDSGTFDLTNLTAVDPTGISGMVMSFAKYPSCSGDDFLLSAPEMDFGSIGSTTVEKTVTLTAQQPMKITHITAPSMSNCSIVPEADCIGRELNTGQTCTIRAKVTGQAAMDAELRIYTNTYSSVPYPVHIVANRAATTACTPAPSVEEAVNLTSVAGVWAFGGNQSQKAVVNSNGAMTSWSGYGQVTVADPGRRAFTFRFGSSAPATLILSETNDRLYDPSVALTTSIVAHHSGKALDIPGASLSNGVAVLQWELHGGANQTFRFEPIGDGTYRIRATQSGKVLDVEGGSLANGARVLQWDWTDGRHQRFWLERLEDDTFRIVAAHSGKVLDIGGGSQDNGAQLIQWDWLGGANQRFRLKEKPPERAVRRPYTSRCLPGETYFSGGCYDVPFGLAMTTPGVMGKPCPADWRDDGTNCWPAWRGVKVASQADPEGSFIERHPIVVTDCVNYSTAARQSCPANFKNTGGPGGCSCEALPTSKGIRTVSGTFPLR